MCVCVGGIGDDDGVIFQIFFGVGMMALRVPVLTWEGQGWVRVSQGRSGMF